MVDFIQTFIDVITKPTKFFNRVKKDNDYLAPWLYFFVVMVCYNIISFLVAIPRILITNEYQALGMSAGAGIALQGGFTLAAILFTSAFVFVSAGILHLFLMIVGASGYLQTFKIVCYSASITLLVAPLMILSIIPFAGPVLWALVLIGASIAAYVIQVTGAKVLHRLTTGRAVVGIVVLPLVTAIIIVTIIVVFIVSALIALGGVEGITGMVINRVL